MLDREGLVKNKSYVEDYEGEGYHCQPNQFTLNLRTCLNVLFAIFHELSLSVYLFK